MIDNLTERKALQAINEYLINRTRCIEPFTLNSGGITRELAIEILVDRLEPLSADWNYEFQGVME